MTVVLPKVSERLQAIVFVAVLVAAVAGLWAATQMAYAPPMPRGVVTASVFVEGAGWSFAYEDVTTANVTAFAFLLEGAAAYGLEVRWTQYGPPLDAVLVTAIGPDRNGEGGSWWQYWVNGVYGQVGADRVSLADGDVVLWRFTTYPPPEVPS